jgi:hypothetical protein
LAWLSIGRAWLQNLNLANKIRNSEYDDLDGFSDEALTTLSKAKAL